MTKGGFVGKPRLVVQQMGKVVVTQDELYRGCYQLRGFVAGCDYYDRDRDEPLGSIARRKSDNVIFAAPDHRFMSLPNFEVLWFQERRLHERRRVGQ